MTELLPFFLVLFAGLFFSEIFRRLHVPWVIALIIGGIIVGPFGLGWLEETSTISFLGEIGLVFLMFMAGLETRLSSLREYRKEVTVLTIFNGVAPFLVGLGIGMLFGFDLSASLLLGIIFISSSIAVVIPSLESNKLFGTRVGKTIMATTMLEDISSLVLLSLFLQTLQPTTDIPLPLFYFLLFGFLWFLRWVLPQIRSERKLFSFFTLKREDDSHERELRKIFALLMGVVVVFELLGLHPITAGFFAGLVLSDTLKSRKLKHKLHAIAYGVFIPVFFVLVGTRTDLRVLVQIGGALWLSVALVVGSILSKLVSGWVGGLVVGFSSRESWLIGVSTIPRLSTTLAVVFAGFELGLLSQDLVTAMIFLSIVTTFVGPILIGKLARSGGMG